MTRRIEIEDLAEALALTLAVDGYIDIEGFDGEQFFHGEQPQVDEITSLAGSLQRMIVMPRAERDALILSIMGRRHAEGRD